MKKKSYRNWLLAAIAVGIAAAVAVAAFYRFANPGYRTASRLVSLLPRADAVVFYADVHALRVSGFLKPFETLKTAQDPEYRSFVTATGFAYERDLDALAIASIPNQLFAVARGTFDWDRLTSYTKAHGGSCKDRYCQVPTGKQDRWFSFFPVRSDVIAVAISEDPRAAYALLPRKDAPEIETPSFPAWAEIPRRVLNDPSSLSPALQVFATALSATSHLTVGLDKAPSGAPGSAVVLRLIANCDSNTQAKLVHDHLEQLTKLFQGLISRQPQPSTDAPDLARLFTSGTFRIKGTDVDGEWLIPRPVLDSLLR